jgi:lipopolysaccharide/colanic/teichoic acid biosynthesis glycosyltransferase
MYKHIKRALDFLVSLILIIITGPIQLLILLGCSISTRSLGLFFQERIGLNGEVFSLVKFKSMIDTLSNEDFQTSINDFRITPFGNFIRRSKLDELPQLYNVLVGQMSFVGPRPDITGYADSLPKDKNYSALVKPGITSPASIFFRDEELILAAAANKKEFNDNIIWPIKAKMNFDYSKHISFTSDLVCLLKTVGIIKSVRFKYE